MKGVRLKAFGVALLGALALIFAGCGQQGGGGNQPPPATTGKVTLVVVDNATGQGVSGYSATYTPAISDVNSVTPGDYTVKVTKTGYFDAFAAFKVRAGETTTVNVSLVPVPQNTSPGQGKVAVLVVNGNGTPIQGATVSDGANTKTTDAQGRADLTYTAAGTHAISVNASGYLGDAKLASVELGKTVALTFKLQPEPTPAPTTGTLVVHVYAEDTGQTLASASVSASPALNFSNGGLFTATASPGTYTVSASAPGYLSGSRAANVEAGKTTVLNLGLRKNTASGPVGGIEILSVKDQWGVDLPFKLEKNPAKKVNLYASQTEEPVCVTVRVTKDGQPVQNARVRVTAVSADPQAVALYKGCETQNVSELDFVTTDANGIAKFSFQGLGNFPVAPSEEPVKFLVSASEEGSGFTASSKEFKVFFYNITHLYLRDGGEDDQFAQPPRQGDDIVKYSDKRTGYDFGTIVNAFDFSDSTKNLHLFRAEVRRKQPTTDPSPITGFGYVRYELVGGDVSKVDLCDLSPDTDPEHPTAETCATSVADSDGSGISVKPKSSVTASDLPISVQVKATLVVQASYGESTYYFPLKDFTFTKTWTGAALAIEKTGPSVIGWSGTSHNPNDVTLIARGASVPSGATYTYTITVKNLSTTETAQNVVITDPLPAELGFVSASSGGTYDAVLHQVTWDQTTTPSLTSIAPGGSVSVTVTVYARHKPGYVWNDKNQDGTADNDTGFGQPGYYYNTRPPVLGTDTRYPDPYPIDNPALAKGSNTPQASTSKRIYVVRPFFTLTKTPKTSSVFRGDLVRFTLTLTNQDRAQAPINDPDYQTLKANYPADYAAALTGYQVKVRDLFGEGLDYVNSSPAGTLDQNGKTLTFDLGDLALGASKEILVDLRASEVGEWQNCARLYAYNLNQRQINADYPRWNVAPQLEPNPGTDPRPSPPYTLETANPDTVGNYLEACASVTVQERPTQYALGISSLGEFNNLTGGTATDPVGNGSDYVYRFEIRAWEGSTGPQTNVTLTLTRTAGNSTFAGTTGVKGVDFEVELDPDGPFGSAPYQTVLNSDVQVVSWGDTGVQIRYIPGLQPGATLRFSVRANAVNGANTTIKADASSTQAPGPYTVFETTTIIP
ncbi:PEGA domain-containing protein [Thermus sp. NEB1569]|uniref:PEGA domain-containing protein n=1 Tax=Thermus sp. NEB1569 TaxID=2918899 RepID=UPI001EFC1BDC|nr:PEGA domain-containing protein [Thermus sp. NEB1569]ULR40937.1 PEGA domain-containing protein [Thermus sp. NEB1569]